MEPQTVIPLARTANELAAIIGTRFRGYVNVLLTIETIEYLLSLNVNNRTVKTTSVKTYEFEFRKTGYECIALMTIDDSGEFADGQHRLIALKRLFEEGWNSEPIWQLVNLSVTKARTESIDNGVVRSATDSLIMDGTVPSLKIARALKTYVLLCNPSLRKTTAAMLREVWNNDFNEIIKIGEFRSVPNSGGDGGYDIPLWAIAGFRLLQKAYGTEKTIKIYEQFYFGNSLDLPMVRFRNFLLTNRFARDKRRIRPWSSDTNCGLAKMFYAAHVCLAGGKTRKLSGKRLGIKVYEREF